MYPSLKASSETSGFVFKYLRYGESWFSAKSPFYLEEMWRKGLWRSEVLIVFASIPSDLLLKIKPKFVAYACDISLIKFLPKSVRITFIPSSSILSDWSRFRNVEQITFSSVNTRRTGRSIRNLLQAWKDNQMEKLTIFEAMELLRLKTARNDQDFLLKHLRETVDQVDEEMAREIVMERKEIGEQFVEIFSRRIRRGDGASAMLSFYLEKRKEDLNIYCIIHFKIADSFISTFPPAPRFSYQNYK